MMTIKQIYDIKLALANKSNLNDLQDLLTAEGLFPTINSNRTIRIDCPEGYDKISESVNNTIPKWYGEPIDNPISLIYNLLPLSNQSCMLRI